MTTNWPTFYQGLDEGEERRRWSPEAQFSKQASYITSNHHQLPLDVDIAHEVVDLIRYDVRQCLFFGNHLQEGLGLSRRGRYQYTAYSLNSFRDTSSQYFLIIHDF